MRRRVLLFILLLSMLLPITGCWNYREIEKLSIVSGFAIDKSETGGYRITFEIVDLNTDGEKSRPKSKLLETEGETVFDAIRNALKYTSPKLYFGHTEIVIISQEVAREGILGILDFISRDAEPRLSIDILVSMGKTAREMLHSQSITTGIRSFEINEMLDTQKDLAKAPKVRAYQFINDLACEGNVPYLPLIHLKENAGVKTTEVNGMAIFKSDKLLGFLNEEECRFFLFLKDEVEGGLLVFKKIPNASNANVTMEIFRSMVKVKPVYSDGKFTINVQVELFLVVGEQDTEINLMQEKGREVMQKYIEDYINESLVNVVKKVQKDYGVDVFGFGRIVHQDMPQIWKEVRCNWNDVFIKLDVQAKTSARILSSGLLSKPIKKGE